MILLYGLFFLYFGFKLFCILCYLFENSKYK